MSDQKSQAYGMMTSAYPGFERPAFGRGQLLSASDLDSLATYTREKVRELLRHLAGPGLAAGLEVAPTTSPGTKVVVAPGYAIDGHGQDLFLKAAAEVDLSGVFTRVAQCGQAGGTGEYYDLYISAADQNRRTSSPCGPYGLKEGKAFPVRVLEGVRFEVLPVQGQAAGLSTLGFEPPADLLWVEDSPASVTRVGCKMWVLTNTIAQPQVGTAKLYNAQTLAKEQEKADLTGVFRLQASPDGQVVYAHRMTEGSISALKADSLDPMTGTPVYTQLAGVWFSNDGRVTLFYDESNEFIIVQAGSAPTRFSVAGWPSAAAVTSRGQVYYGQGYGKEGILAHDPVTGVTRSKAGFPSPDALVLSHDERLLLAVQGGACAVMVLDATDLSVIGAIPTGYQPRQILLHPNLPMAVTINEGSRDVTLIDFEKGRAMAALRSGSRPVWSDFDAFGRLWVPDHPWSETSMMPMMNVESRRAEGSVFIHRRSAFSPAASARPARACVGAIERLPLARIHIVAGKMTVEAADIDGGVRDPYVLPSLAELREDLND